MRPSARLAEYWQARNTGREEITGTNIDLMFLGHINTGKMARDMQQYYSEPDWKDAALY